MTNGVRWAIAFAGLPLAGVTPFLWWWSRPLLWVACVLLLVWSVWLVVEYLRWARTLRQ